MARAGQKKDFLDPCIHWWLTPKRGREGGIACLPKIYQKERIDQELTQVKCCYKCQEKCWPLKSRRGGGLILGKI